MRTAEDFRKALSDTKNRSLDGVRTAVENAISTVSRQMDDALAGLRTNCGDNPYFGAAMPADAYHNGSYEDFLRLLRDEMSPLGYIVQQSHDGGGMYSTYVVKMANVRKPVVRKGPFG